MVYYFAKGVITIHNATQRTIIIAQCHLKPRLNILSSNEPFPLFSDSKIAITALLPEKRSIKLPAENKPKCHLLSKGCHFI